jgi:hypothetical protein
LMAVWRAVLGAVEVVLSMVKKISYILIGCLDQACSDRFASEDWVLWFCLCSACLKLKSCCVKRWLASPIWQLMFIFTSQIFGHSSR